MPQGEDRARGATSEEAEAVIDRIGDALAAFVARYGVEVETVKSLKNGANPPLFGRSEADGRGEGRKSKGQGAWDRVWDLFFARAN